MWDAKNKQAGFSIVELTISMVISAMIIVAFFGLYATLLGASRYTKLKSVALTLATNHMEYLKSLPYDQLAVTGGNIVAAAYLPQTVSKTVDGVTYTVRNDIDYADDSFDGCASYPTVAIAQKLCRNYPAPTGSPVDSNPKDYKVIDVIVLLQSSSKQLAEVSTNVSARVAETSSNTGALVVTVVDDQGNPISNASVSVLNSTVSPSINQTDSTDVNGTAIFYDLPPDTTNYDYKVTASKTDYTTLATISPTGSLQPYYPSQQVIAQQSSLLTMILRPKGTYSLAVEATNTAGTALSGAKIYIKGGYKSYNSTTNTAYYYDNMTPSDARPTTDVAGTFSVQNLDPGPYIFCGDAGATSCSVGGTTYYLAAAVPYGGDNSFNPIQVPNYLAASPPATMFAYGGNNYLQKVRLMLTTSSTFPRIRTLTPDDASIASSGISSFAFVVKGNNLPCTSSAASCQTVVRFKQGASTYTASCTGASSGIQLNCTVNLSSATLGLTTMEVVANSQTLTIPAGMIGGINVVN